MIHFLTLKSMANRKFTSFLCVLSIALSVTLFLGVERMREGAKDGFTNTISGVDLIVGAKGGALQLLLYTVFHLGSAVNNVRMSTYNEIKSHRSVEWAIPISLGDNYRGHRVIATDENFFLHYQFRGDQKIKFADGTMPLNIFDVVLGSAVANKLKHRLGDPISLTHGTNESSLYQHEKTPFKVVGMLAPTSTPIDNAVIINLYGMEAMHVGWESGVPTGDVIDPTRYQKENLEINQITSFMLKLKSRIAVLKMRRTIDTFEAEPVMAIIPGMALSEMWQTLGAIEKILFLISGCVLIVGLVSIVISLYTSINERRREMAIFRSLGAKSQSILALIVYEAMILVSSGIILGVTLLYTAIFALKPLLESRFSIYLENTFLTSTEWGMLLFIFIFGVLAGLIPGVKAMQRTLQDGLIIKN